MLPSTSFSNRLLMAGKVTCLPSRPPKGEVLTENVIDTTGGSNGMVLFF